MQVLVYFFIFLFGISFSVATYYALTFTMVEALLSGFIAASWAILIYERKLRLRAEARLEKAIEDLSELLSTDAKAGQILSKRVNVISDEKAGDRLEVIEADFSVLGTLVRQVAESVAQIEEEQAKIAQVVQNSNINISQNQNRNNIQTPSIPASDVKKAIKDKKINFYLQPIISLPQREIIAYDLSARMEIKDNKQNSKIVEAKEFIPISGNDALVREIDQIGFVQVFSLAKQSIEAKVSVIFYVPISNASLRDNAMLAWLIAQLEISRAMANNICFIITQQQWDNSTSLEKAKLSSLTDVGATISISNVSSLRQNFGDLKKHGVNSVRADATTFIDNPQKYSDFHGADVADYIHRYNIDLIICDVKSEQQVLTLLEDGVKQVIGDYIVPAGLAEDMIEIADSE